jgi:hypothetical protein
MPTLEPINEWPRDGRDVICTACGARVPADHAELHYEWHDDLLRRVKLAGMSWWRRMREDV